MAITRLFQRGLDLACDYITTTEDRPEMYGHMCELQSYLTKSLMVIHTYWRQGNIPFVLPPPRPPLDQVLSKSSCPCV